MGKNVASERLNLGEMRCINHHPRGVVLEDFRGVLLRVGNTTLKENLKVFKADSIDRKKCCEGSSLRYFIVKLPLFDEFITDCKRVPYKPCVDSVWRNANHARLDPHSP